MELSLVLAFVLITFEEQNKKHCRYDKYDKTFKKLILTYWN